jgi:hypothetical protein
MIFLRKKDITAYIQADNLQQIIQDNDFVLEEAERSALSEMTSYLVQRYETQTDFAPILQFSLAATYAVGARVELNAAPYSNIFSYQSDDLVAYNGKVYVCILASQGNQVTNGTYWTLVGNQNDLYSCTAVSIGNLVNDTDFFEAKDTRNAYFVEMLIHLVLHKIHSRISLRNIPELRVINYDNAIRTLKMYAKGDITADLTVKEEPEGNRIRYGSNLKNTYQY